MDKRKRKLESLQKGAEERAVLNQINSVRSLPTYDPEESSAKHDDGYIAWNNSEGRFATCLAAEVVTKNMQPRVVSLNANKEDIPEDRTKKYKARKDYQNKKKKLLIPKGKNKENINHISNSETSCTCKVKSGEKWKVGRIDITNKFQAYQTDILGKSKTEDPKYSVYETLALSSIMILKHPCPYPIFSAEEWNDIMDTNPYTIQESLFPQDISTSLHKASFNHFIGKEVYMESGGTSLKRRVARCFNDLYDGIPQAVSPKTTEEEHCYTFLYPIIRPFFSGEKPYNFVLNRANLGKERPDLSYYIKVQLKGRKSIDQQLKEKNGPGEAASLLKCNGIYRSWSFMTAQLVTNKASIPLAESAIHHFATLEQQVGKVAKNFVTPNEVLL
ncbi:17886_t:CDS:10 [Gigaspora margarita]|uniref:17886_t:CDS:1 n=1 Tax=Gigaspora margarita TaxID=4874 RepID=A0ABN7VGH4_GIGMA|nr:17886_t:CDS:10 [Gigaspora margarita]